MIALMRMEDKWRRSFVCSWGKTMAKKNWTPEDREKVIALIREVQHDVRELRERLQAIRETKR